MAVLEGDGFHDDSVKTEDGVIELLFWTVDQDDEVTGFHLNIEDVSVARHRSHPAVIAAGAVAEDRQQATHRPGTRIPDVIRRVHMTEEHEPWRHLGNTLPEGTATHELHLVMVVVGRIEDTVRGTVCDEHV